MVQKNKRKLTLQALLTTHGEIKEQTEAIDYAMNAMIAMLRHEPLRMEETVESYESLYLLRKVLEPYKPE